MSLRPVIRVLVGRTLHHNDLMEGLLRGDAGGGEGDPKVSLDVGLRG